MKFFGFLRAVKGEPALKQETARLILDSHSGYEREAAARALADKPFGPALPQLLERCNDWVPQVRAAASKAVRAMLTEQHEPHWLPALAAVTALSQGQRADHQQLLDEIATYLSAPARLSRVLHQARTEGIRVRRYVADLAWHACEDDGARRAWLAKALSGSDVVVASQALSRLRERGASAPTPDLVAIAAVSHLGLVRYAAIRWAVEHPDQETPAIVQSLCFDPNGHVRWWCLRWYRQHDQVGVVTEWAQERCLAQSGTARSQSTAFQILRELDIDRAREVSEYWLLSDAPRLRRDALALRLFSSKDAEQQEWIKQACQDESGKVHQLVLQAVRQGIEPPDAKWLLALLEQRPSPSTFTLVLSLWRHAPLWQRLICLLASQSIALKVDLPSAWCSEIDLWLQASNRGARAPSSAEVQEIQHLWQTNSGGYGAYRDELRFTLDVFKVL